MNSTRSVCAVLLGGCFLAMNAHAELRVLLSGGGEPGEGQVEISYDETAGGYRIELLDLYDPGGWSRYTIVGDGGEVIEEILIDIGCWEDQNGDCIPAGSPVEVKILSEGVDGIRTVRNVIQTGTAETLISRIEVREDLGRVEAETIGQVFVGRDIIGPIIATTENNENRGITDVWAGRNILGDVRADNGRIVLVYAYGTIGTRDQPVKIHARHNIYQVTGEQGIFADINTRVNGGQGGLSALTGDRFVGRFETEALIQNPWSGLLGGIRFWTEFKGEIVIGQSFVNAWGIELPPNGLTGQITFNADGEGDGAWTSPVYIGPVDDPETPVLDGPDYDASALDLGGGSIGLVPFALHETSCSPVNGGVLYIEQPRSLEGLKLRHYGPVKMAGADVVRLSRRPIGDSGPFEPFTATIALDVDNDDANTLVLGPTGLAAALSQAYEYQIEPGPDLRCDAVQSPAVKWAQPYRFTVEFVEAQCPADLNGDAMVNSDDLFELLGDWGASNSAADLDASGLVNADDLFLLLGQWGSCPSERGESSAPASQSGVVKGAATSKETQVKRGGPRRPARSR